MPAGSYIRTEEHKENISKSLLGTKNPNYGNKIKRIILDCDHCHMKFERVPCYVRRNQRLNKRYIFCSKFCSSKHRTILSPPPSRKGITKYPNISNRDKKKFDRKVYKKRYREAGKMDIKTIQLVYENNIKKYGTLTCVYCLMDVSFGKDSIDHKMPLIRGGTHSYENLCIACKSCNSKKRAKTEDEFRKVLI